MVRIARRELHDVNEQRGAVSVIGGVNTDALGQTRVPASCRCIAAGCMMWRWVDEGPYGYCGLAGPPDLPAGPERSR